MTTMKIIEKPFLMIMILASMLLGCEDNNATEDVFPKEVDHFIESVNTNPVLIDGIKLGDSWRLTRNKYAYNDGEHRKENDIDYLTDLEYSNYKEYWTFDQDRVLITYEGELHGKKLDGYYEIFSQSTDPEKRVVSIHYVYEGEDKRYTINWTITSLTETELILTEEIPEEDYFYQYTFRREKFN